MNLADRSLFISFFCVLVSAATLLLYFPALSGDFYHDDLPNLVQNEKIQILHLDWESFKTASLSSESGILKRPVSMASFAMNYYLFGPQPGSFKITNLIIHIANGLLVFVVAFLIKKNIPTTNSKNDALLFAAIVSALWLLHPLQVSTVAYIVQRMTMLAMLFSLLALIFYILGRVKLSKNNFTGLWYYAGSLLCVSLAVLSKENGILIIPIIFFTELLVFGFQPKNSTGIKVTKLIYLIGFLLVSALLVYKLPTLVSFISAGYSTREFSIEERLYTQLRALSYYIKWLAIPSIQELGLFHDDIPVSKGLLQPMSTLAAAIFLTSSLLLTFIFRSKYPILFFGLIWFFCGHILESSVIALELVYEHRNYLPSVGIFFIIAELIGILATLINQRTAIILTAVFISILSFSTYLRATQWTDIVSFSHYEATHHPKSPRANFALGRLYANLTLSGEIRFKESAFSYLERAHKLDKAGILPETVLIMLAKRTNTSVNSTWFSSIVRKLESQKLNASDITSIKSLVLCPQNECLLSTEEANQLFDALSDNPIFHSSNVRRADLLTIQANFLTNRIHNFQEAEKLMREAISLRPETQQYLINHINLLLYIQNVDLASAQIEKLKQLDPLGANSKTIALLEKDLKIITANITSKNNEK